ncbi:MAG: 3-methyl-2-oxobutanoate hydroxymethyltransferase [Candidatus Caenarcaniphilales bacterium]|nr:3-methyl-2-oxobutanoate hydroxymethyltransferase [Candidatus Caenarcaniphilales bacterium]
MLERQKKVQVPDLKVYKDQKRKITCLTAYDYLTACLLDESGVDLILVGDSLAHVFAGLSNTSELGMTEMIYHTQVVAGGVERALLVADMPFLSYQIEIAEAARNAGELIRAGAQAVKLEGGSEYIADLISKLTSIGIPVIGHLGYTPQSVNLLGRGRVQGRDDEMADRIFKQAALLESTGAAAIVIELVPADLARRITDHLSIPTIGIGSGGACDGQILVTDDVLGRTNNQFRFLKRFAELNQIARSAVKDYIQEVQSGSYPTDEHSF